MTSTAHGPTDPDAEPAIAADNIIITLTQPSGT
jgi:hypothetical protein